MRDAVEVIGCAVALFLLGLPRCLPWHGPNWEWDTFA